MLMRGFISQSYVTMKDFSRKLLLVKSVLFSGHFTLYRHVECHKGLCTYFSRYISVYFQNLKFINKQKLLIETIAGNSPEVIDVHVCDAKKKVAFNDM